MILSSFIDGLRIIQNYYDKDGYNIGAEHDIFYLYPTSVPVGKEDLTKLAELGWFQEGVKPFNGEEWTPADYDPQESWTVYT